MIARDYWADNDYAKDKFYAPECADVKRHALDKNLTGGAEGFTTLTEVFGTVSASKFLNIKLNRGDLILLLSAGGGYGAPDGREEKAVHEDFAAGFVSAEGLRAYGREAENY